MIASIAKKIILFLILSVCLTATLISFTCAQEINSVLPSTKTLSDQAIQMAREGHAVQALTMMEDALRSSSNESGLDYDYVVILSWAEKHTEAIKKFEDLRKTRAIPDYVLPQVAASYRHIGEFDKSIQEYKEYLSRHPLDQAAIEGIIYCYLDSGKNEEALALVKQLENEYPDKTLMLKSIHADVIFQKGDVGKALQLYAEAFRDNPNDLHAQIGIIRSLIAQNRALDVGRSIDVVLEKDPHNYTALICKGEILEAEGKYFQAYQHYERILSLFPNSRVVKGLEYRALMRLGATSLAKELLEKDKIQIDPEIKAMLAGDEVVAHIRWNEPKEALETAMLNEMELIGAQAKNPDQAYPERALLRNYYDELAALRMQEAMAQTIRNYNILKALKITIPPWTLTQAADAYLYLQQPEQALALYRQALEIKWDPDGMTQMSIYDTLIELGRFQEAESILNQLINKTSAQVVTRGVLRNNWTKEDIAVNRGWWLLYQDRLKEADAYLLEYLLKAPANTHLRTALAQTYLWRGWPRLALQEFQISENLDDKDISAKIGKAYALNENDQGAEARCLAKELKTLYPTNKHIQQLNRYFDIQDMRTLTVNVGYSTEHPGGNELAWSTRIDQPIFPWRNIFAEYIWRRNHSNDSTQLIRRNLYGVDWRLTRDWWFTGGLSTNYNGTEPGHFENLTFTPDDHWLLSAGYDSYITDLPLRESSKGVTADEYSWVARYRSSEDFIAELHSTYRNYSDNNDQLAYNLKLDKALTSGAYWKTRLAFEGYTEINSKTDVDYFSPSGLYSFYLIPMVEHVWFRRYERALVDRFYFGLGKQWQKNYGSHDLWYVRYELDHRISDLWGILLGTTYAKKNYDGDSTNAWTTYLTFKRHF